MCAQTRGWVITGKDVESVTKQLRDLLRKSGAQVADLLRLFDQDADTALLIDDMEFHKAMRGRFGFRGSSMVISQVFKTLDRGACSRRRHRCRRCRCRLRRCRRRRCCCCHSCYH